jgi:hypothetical protein
MTQLKAAPLGLGPTKAIRTQCWAKAQPTGTVLLQDGPRRHLTKMQTYFLNGYKSDRSPLILRHLTLWQSHK